MNRPAQHIGNDAGYISIQDELVFITRSRSLREGESIVRQGEATTILGKVVSGVLRTLTTMSDGRQQIVGLTLPNGHFGRIYSNTSLFAIEAATDVIIQYYDKSSFEKLIERNEDLSRSYLISTLDELDAARDWIVLLGCQTALEKIATFLIHLYIKAANEHPDERATEQIAIPLSRRDTACFLGTTTETVCRAYQQLSRKGAIRIVDAQNFMIVNWDRLIRMSGKEELGEIIARIAERTGLPRPIKTNA